MGAHSHGHGPVLLEKVVIGCAAVHYGDSMGVGLEPMPESGR
jgi:hypothetical protein